MDSTVQTVQEVGSQVSQYKQMFENYLPDITKFGIKVVLAIVAFWVGSTVIKWIVKFVRKSLTKSRLDTGVAQFQPGRRNDASSVQAFPGGRLHHRQRTGWK